MNDKDYQRIEKIKNKLTVERNHLGKAGEYFVAGKLLLNGFNVYNGAIDDGIDLVARKKRKFYYIQVKTCQDIEYDSGKFIARINLSSLSKYPQNNTFLILVLHLLGPTASLDSIGDHNRYDQEFVVIPANKLSNFFNKITGYAILHIHYSPLMDIQNNIGWIVKLLYGGKEFILDNYLIDSFWQIEI